RKTRSTRTRTVDTRPGTLPAGTKGSPLAIRPRRSSARSGTDTRPVLPALRCHDPDGGAPRRDGLGPGEDPEPDPRHPGPGPEARLDALECGGRRRQRDRTPPSDADDREPDRGRPTVAGAKAEDGPPLATAGDDRLCRGEPGDDRDRLGDPGLASHDRQ